MNLMDEIHKDCGHIRTIANAIGHLSDDIEIRSIAGLDLPSSPAQPIDARSIHDRAITMWITLHATHAASGGRTTAAGPETAMLTSSPSRSMATQWTLPPTGSVVATRP